MSGVIQEAPPVLPNRSRRWSLAASVSSILSAFIASACCAGPLVFALLGIGGVGFLVKFEPYRLYFVAATFALLGTGFYLTYRKSKTATMPTEGSQECVCPAPNANRAGKIILWIATILALCVLSFPYITPYIFR